MLEGGTEGQVSAGQCHPAGHMERVPCGVWQPEGLCAPWQRGPDSTVLGTGWNWSRWESRRAGGSGDTGSGVLNSAQKISNVSENTRIMESFRLEKPCKTESNHAPAPARVPWCHIHMSVWQMLWDLFG